MNMQIRGKSFRKITRWFAGGMLALAMSGAVHAAPTYVTGTYFGGTEEDGFDSVRFAPDGTIVCGANVTSSGSIAGKAPVILGSTSGTAVATAAIVRFSNSGQSVLSYTRFQWGSVSLKRIAVDASGIYIAGFADANFASMISSLGGFDRTAPSSGKKPCVAKLALDGSRIIAGTYLEGIDSSVDNLGIGIRSNGDIVVSHDNGSGDYISCLSADLKLRRWRANVGTRAGSCRIQGLTVSPSDDKIYVIGYGMGSTTQEPLKGPFCYKYNASNGVQEWLKSNSNYAIWNWSPREGDGRLNGLISDSTGYYVAVDGNGHPLITAYADGGASVLLKDPNDWTVEAPNKDGDGTWGFCAATSASVVGRMDKNTHQWIRLNTLAPRFTNTSGQNCVSGNTIVSVCGMANDRVLQIGWVGSGLTGTGDAWFGGTSGDFIIKSKMDSTGTVREFITRLPAVGKLRECARYGTGNRYAIVGRSAGGATTKNAVQATFAGGNGKDAYLIVMDDDAGGNVAPTVSLTSPANGATYNAPANIILAASASDSNGTISKVEFFRGSTAMGTDTISPYSITWSSVAAGAYALTARATDNGGAVTTSTTVNVTVAGTVAGGTNIAQGKSATQSTTLGADGAQKAVDGNTDGNHNNGSVTHTSNGSQNWWQVDLGSVSNISSIKVWNRTDCCQARLSNFYVFVSDVPFTSNDVNTTKAQSGVSNYFTSGTAPVTTTFSVGRTGRYVRVQLTSTTEPLSLAEVQVFN